MPFVNYVKEHTAFIEYAADNNLRPNEILVWEALFHIMNQRSNGNYWPDGFIRVKNDRLLTYAPIGFDSLSRARNMLAQRGLISYKPGKRNSDIPLYEMHFLTAVVQNCAETVDNAECSGFYPVFYPQKTDNIGGNIRGNIRDNMWGKIGGKLSDQFININKTVTETKPVHDDDDDDDDDKTRAGAHDEGDKPDGDSPEFTELVNTAANAVQASFGREATPAEARMLAIKANLLDFGPVMLAHAIHIAALHGAREPLGYSVKIMIDWNRNAVTTPDEADEYQIMQDAVSGRNPFASSGDHIHDLQRMTEAREERIKRHEERGGC